MIRQITASLIVALLLFDICRERRANAFLFNCRTNNMHRSGKSNYPPTMYYGPQQLSLGFMSPAQRMRYPPNMPMFQPVGLMDRWTMLNANQMVPNWSNYGAFNPAYSSQQISPTSWSKPSSYNYNSLTKSSQLIARPYSIKQQQLRSPASLAYGLKGGKKYSPSKSTLLADGGYDSFDAHQMVGNSYWDSNRTTDYTLPISWPFGGGGSAESQAKIIQQLLKYGVQGRPQAANRLAPLLKVSSSDSSQFSILDEPRFVGFGTVEALNNREAKLSCSFNEAVDQTNRPLWIKFIGPYNSSQVVGGLKMPPFNCANSQCRTQEIESTQDYRYKFDNGPATSTLTILEPRLSDYGAYRCSALTKAISGNPLETIYQVVLFGDSI